MSTLKSNGKPQACKTETTEVPELDAGGAAIALALLSGLLMLRRERKS